MYSCIILDDDLMAITQLKLLISKSDDLLFKKAFTKAKDAIEFLQTETIDIIFLDIYLEETLGTEVATNMSSDTFVIFTTSSLKHALEAWNLGAVDYLQKPIDVVRFNKAIDKVILPLKFKDLSKDDAKLHQGDSITISSDRKKYHAKISDILYIESKLEYLCYYTKKGKIMSLGSLKEIALKLPKTNFIRISYSFIINLQHIRRYNTSEIEMDDDCRIKVGRVYKNDFKNIMNSHQS